MAAAPTTTTAPATLPGAFKPPVAKKRPAVKSRKLSLRFCARIAVSRKSLVVGARGPVSLKVTAGGLAVPGLRLRISGAGVDKIVRTGKGGNVSVNVIPAKAGILRITSLGRKGCNTARIGAVGSFEPPVTG